MANEIDIQISLDIKQGVSEIQKFSKSASDSIENITKSVTDLEKNSSKNIFKGALGADLVVEAFHGLLEIGHEVIGFIGESISAAIKQEEIELKLAGALRETGSATQEQVKAFSDYAEELSHTTKFQDEAIVSNIAYLKSLGATNEQTQKVIDAAVDLSAATGKDLNSSVQLLAKTFTGSTAGLGKYAAEIKHLTQAQLSAGKAVDIIGSKFEGLAESQLTGASGQLNLLGKNFEDLQKAVGAAVTQNPVFIEGLQTINDLLSATVEFVKENKDAFIELSLAGKVFALDLQADINTVIATIASLLSIIPGIGHAFKDIAGAADDVAASFSADSKKAADQLAKFTVSSAQAAANTGDISKSLKDAAGAASGLSTNLENSPEKLLEKVKELTKELKKVGVSQQAVIEGEYKKRVDLIHKAAEAGVIAGVNAEQLISQARKDFIQKDIELFQKKLTDISNNPFEIVFHNKENAKNTNKPLSEGQKTAGDIISGIAGLIGSITKGAAGAAEFVAKAAGAVAEFLSGIPGLGQFIETIVKFLSQGPELVKQQILGFIKEIPNVLKNIITAIPAIFEALFEDTIFQNLEKVFSALPEFVSRFISVLVTSIPEFINGLVDGLPDFIVALIELLPQIYLAFIVGIINGLPKIIQTFGVLMFTLGPKIAAGLISALIKEIPRFVSAAAQALADAVKGAISGITNIGDNVGNFFSDVGSTIGGIFGFADGGRIVDSPRFANDGVVARVGAGEQILGADLSEKLDTFLSKTGSSGGAVGGPQSLTVNLVIGQEQLANVILNLNRNGFRTA